MIQSYNSTLLDNAVAELAKLPGIGSKTALRLALHLLRRDVEEVTSLANAITKMRSNINYCKYVIILVSMKNVKFVLTGAETNQ